MDCKPNERRELQVSELGYIVFIGHITQFFVSILLADCSVNNHDNKYKFQIVASLICG